MIFFAVLGLAFYLLICFQVGYLLAMTQDAKARLDAFMKPVTYELEVLIAMLPREPK